MIPVMKAFLGVGVMMRPSGGGAGRGAQGVGRWGDGTMLVNASGNRLVLGGMLQWKFSPPFGPPHVTGASGLRARDLPPTTTVQPHVAGTQASTDKGNKL
ncbi:hypothetical protein KFL01_13250 [Kocuria flava]|uniref:Uncharacterized protein n=1 Tax=Kocuria flava TaxID=446860 RepID=A0ABQ0X4N7_9MICC|nr:hypothetical protein KFL01_13250 [Kocuria flava]